MIVFIYSTGLWLGGMGGETVDGTRGRGRCVICRMISKC